MTSSYKPVGAPWRTAPHEGIDGTVEQDGVLGMGTSPSMWEAWRGMDLRHSLHWGGGEEGED